MNKLEGLDGVGWFWRADDPAVRAPGRIEFTDDGRCLIQVLSPDTSYLMVEMTPEGKTIHGTVNSKDITLLWVHERRTQLFSGAQTLEASLVLVGAHHGPEVGVLSLRGKFDNLTPWVNTSRLAEPDPLREPRGDQTGSSQMRVYRSSPGWSARR